MFNLSVKQTCFSRLYLFLFFYFTLFVVFAQTGTIKGKIFDADADEGLFGATILVQDLAKGAVADFEGTILIPDVPIGTYTLVASYIGYKTLTDDEVVVENGKTTNVKFLLKPSAFVLNTVQVVARVNRESEIALLNDQRQALLPTQAVGVRELSRKGIGDAQAAVAQVSGVSRQDGVKNVFVRGLGDRYNATQLNGFPIPSEDPEYKNIALDFFGTDVIKNIGVSKVFSSSNYADVGGAIIDISSKELVNDYELNISLSGGVNSAVVGTDFLRQDGSNYLGFASKQKPTDSRFYFANSLDPSTLNVPINHSFGVSGGKIFKIGENENPLSLFVIASHSSDYSYTHETIRNANTAGMIWQDQKGSKYSLNTNQLALVNAAYDINPKHRLHYNFMLIHANEQYVGEYSGYNGEKYQDSPNYMGIMRRQQTNDNLLVVNQLLSTWELSKSLKLETGVSYNVVHGAEPDRRENNFSLQQNGMYNLTKSNRQKRFFSDLTDNDFNAKTAITYHLTDRYETQNSILRVGYNGRLSNNRFEALEYNFTAPSGDFDPENGKLDDIYNQLNLNNNNFIMTKGDLNSYEVLKSVHSLFVEAQYQLLQKLSGNIGLRVDAVDMTVDYRVQHVAPGEKQVKQNFFMPSLNLKYDISGKSSIRLGANKTYTLPQSKEMAPYQYVNISFVSQGNPDLKPSENYNADLKWDYYLSSAELISLAVFYKHILNPIGRVDKGNSAGLLSYDNVSDYATIGGVEMEMRKNIFNRLNTETEQINRLSMGLNASFIYTNLTLNILNTTPHSIGLEGASPFLANADLTYSYTKAEKSLTAAVVFNYFSRRIYTMGAGGFNDIMEEGVPTLDFAASYKLDKHFTIKLKAANLLNFSYRLTRETSSGQKITLNEYKKGQDFSVGISYDF